MTYPESDRPALIPQISDAAASAGAAVFLRYDPEVDDPDQVARQVFRAMLAASHLSAASRPR